MSSTPEGDSVEQQLASVSNALGIPESTTQTARDRLTRVRSVTALENKSPAVVGAATLSLTCRDDGLPIMVPDIADAWSQTLQDGRVEPEEMTALFGVLTANLDFQGTPPQPRALIERFGNDLGLPDGVIVVANRILVDIFAENPTMVADGSSSDGIAGSILYLAAKINGYDDITESDISDTLGTGQFTVQNRSKKIRDMLGKERLANDDRYHLNTEGVPKSNREGPATARAPTAADGNPADADTQDGPDHPADDDQAADTADQTDTPDDTEQAEASEAADADDAEEAAEASGDEESGDDEPGDDETIPASDIERVVQSLFPEELPTTDHVAEELDITVDAAEAALAAAEESGEIERKSAGTTVVWLPGERTDLSPDLTEDAVQNEVDEFVETLDLSASLRVFARGLVSDAVDTLAVENAEEMAGAAVLAACKIQDIDVDATEIAEAGGFETRALYTWLEKLATTSDVEIPRPSAEAVAERLGESLSIDESVREESLDALEQYEPRETDPEYTAPELAAGGIIFAATVSGVPVDMEELSAASGADIEYINHAKNSILISLCHGLVKGDLDYDETLWTADLLESDLSQDFGDDEVQKAVALAKTYVAGRESQGVDDATVGVLLGE